VGDEYRGYRKEKAQRVRDTAVKIQGPIAGVMLEAFQESWQEMRGPEIRENLAGLTKGQRLKKI